MDRRHILKTTVALAALPTFLASGAFAQETADADAERTHAEQTKKVGAVSLATSRIAIEKAADPMVKAFAKWEVAEQETIADILKTMERGDKAEGALKPPSESEVDAMLDADGKSSLEKLRGISGPDFDKTYLAVQLDGHNKLLTIQEDYLKVGQNREHLSVTELARGQIKDHIEHLQMMSKA